MHGGPYRRLDLLMVSNRPTGGDQKASGERINSSCERRNVQLGRYAELARRAGTKADKVVRRRSLRIVDLSRNVRRRKGLAPSSLT